MTKLNEDTHLVKLRPVAGAVVVTIPAKILSISEIEVNSYVEVSYEDKAIVIRPTGKFKEGGGKYSRFEIEFEDLQHYIKEHPELNAEEAINAWRKEQIQNN